MRYFAIISDTEERGPHLLERVTIYKSTTELEVLQDIKEHKWEYCLWTEEHLQKLQSLEDLKETVDIFEIDPVYGPMLLKVNETVNDGTFLVVVRECRLPDERFFTMKVSSWYGRTERHYQKRVSASDPIQALLKFIHEDNIVDEYDMAEHVLSDYINLHDPSDEEFAKIDIVAKFFKDGTPIEDIQLAKIVNDFDWEPGMAEFLYDNEFVIDVLDPWGIRWSGSSSFIYNEEEDDNVEV